MAKGPPSQDTLAIRAFGKVRRLRGEIERRDKAHYDSKKKWLVRRESLLAAAEGAVKDYETLTGETIPASTVGPATTPGPE